MLAFTGIARAQIEQEGYQFRKDDGSESTAVWMAAQDKRITRPLGTAVRLRVLLNATGDPASTQYQLEYRKSTDASYTRIGATVYETIAVRSEGTGSGTTNAVDGTFTVTKPADIVNGDYVVVVIGKIDDPDVAPPAGMTTGNEGSGTSGNDAFGGIYYKKIVDAINEINYVFDSAGTSEAYGYWVGSLSGIDQASPEDVAFNGTGAWVYSTNDTSPNLPAVTTVTPGAFAIGAWELNTDTATTQPGGSWNSRADDVDNLNVVSQIFATAGTSTGTDSLSSVAGGQESETGTFVFRPAVGTPPIVMNASANIAASGENTTFQLAVPSGKATSDFVTGRIQDDENPADAVDITTNDYTELEWSITSQSPAVNGYLYEFRVTANGTALGTYTVTPQWLLGTRTRRVVRH